MATNEPTRQSLPAGTGPEYWRGLEDLTDSPEFRELLAREFPDDHDRWTDPRNFNRRA